MSGPEELKIQSVTGGRWSDDPNNVLETLDLGGAAQVAFGDPCPAANDPSGTEYVVFDTDLDGKPDFVKWCSAAGTRLLPLFGKPLERLKEGILNPPPPERRPARPPLTLRTIESIVEKSEQAMGIALNFKNHAVHALALAARSGTLASVENAPSGNGAVRGSFIVDPETGERAEFSLKKKPVTSPEGAVAPPVNFFHPDFDVITLDFRGVQIRIDVDVESLPIDLLIQLNEFFHGRPLSPTGPKKAPPEPGGTKA